MVTYGNCCDVCCAEEFTYEPSYVEGTPKVFNYSGGFNSVKKNTGEYSFSIENYYIERVLYRDPVTIVFWSDGTKTVTKCTENDRYSKEIGLALCVAKKVCGATKMRELMHMWANDNVCKENEDGSYTVVTNDVRKYEKSLKKKSKNTTKE